MNSKTKAEVDTLKVLGEFVLVGAVVLILGIFFRLRVDAAEIALNPIEMTSINNLCGARGQQLIAISGELQEPKEQPEGDGFPDDCDTCLGGDNRKISNSQGIADACYVKQTKENKIRTYKDMCKEIGGCYISETSQCCIGKPKSESRCGTECKT